MQKNGTGLIYDIHDKPPFGKIIVFSLQQLLAIIAATILVPMLVNSYGAVDLQMDTAAALLGAGVGTFVYILFTKAQCPVFLGSSFAFLSALYSATVFGYCGIIVGGILAGAVYVVIAIIVHFTGTKWVSRLLPPVIIGPTVAIIGLGLSGSAISNFTSGLDGGYNLIAILCGVITFIATVLAATFGRKTMRLIPFIIGIIAGYIACLIFSLIGIACNAPYLQLIDFSIFKDAFSPFTVSSIIHVPKFAFVEAGREIGSFEWGNLGTLALLFMPVAFVVLAEHIADHKNLGTVIGRELVDSKAPGLTRTLLGDGVGSMVGAFFGCCPNTTYGESVGCVAITKNASIYSIIGAAGFSILLSFFTPFVVFVRTIPSCVIGGICVCLYGFIAVSGLKMLQPVDLSNNRNLFVVSAVFVPGIGGLTLNFGARGDGSPVIQITAVAVALFLGIFTNFILGRKKADEAPVKTSGKKGK